MNTFNGVLDSFISINQIKPMSMQVWLLTVTKSAPMSFNYRGISVKMFVHLNV